MKKWFTGLTPRQQKMVMACCHYAERFQDAGLPGAGLFLLVANLAALLDAAYGE